ncbi:MAG TPA: TadE/TadG family type IV pilus assembly protein [Reyranella sp.]|nr:TadE/TadG family type IV pilus assembly protein [Reyranella sp.]
MRPRSLWRDSRGGAAIEFAIIAPLFFTLILGTLDFGRMFYVSQSLQHATQQAGRYYTLNNTAATSTVTSYLQCLMPSSGASGSCPTAGSMGSNTAVSYSDTTNCNSNSSVTCTTITATYSFTFIASYLGLGTKTLRATSQAVRITQ